MVPRSGGTLAARALVSPLRGGVMSHLFNGTPGAWSRESVVLFACVRYCVWGGSTARACLAVRRVFSFEMTESGNPLDDPLLPAPEGPQALGHGIPFL